MTKQWFDVDRSGLGKQAEQHGKGRLVGELIQNALDEVGVTRIEVTLNLVPGRPMADLTVEDDSPEGFRDLGHAYTLFAESYKRSNPEQRGQYNFGEKLVLAVCESASISTTKGTVFFDPNEGRIEKPRQKRERGSVFQGRIRMTREEHPGVLDYLRSLLLPESVVVTLNGERLASRTPTHSFETSLETPVADEQGVMRMRVRKTTVSIHEALPGETPCLYEMGLPIVESDDKWHVSIGQKVPLNRDRDNVRPAYLRAVRTTVLNEMYDRLTEQDANEVWVRQASSDSNCTSDAIKKVLDLRFGEKRAAYDPTDPEANKTWVSKGGTLVYGSMLNKEEWKKAKEADAIQPAGRLCPSPKPYSQDPNAKPVTIIPESQWTDGVRNIVAYAKFLGRELMGVDVTVTVVSTTNCFAACYGPGRLDFNVLRLGYGWFDHGANEEVDRLLLHEYGHHYSRDHLSEEYHEALCQLGAKIKKLALEKPEAFNQFIRTEG
ncbi:MAG: hypothetical protein AABP62_10435 [Planctomycetota bacterium]